MRKKHSKKTDLTNKIHALLKEKKVKEIAC